jgi:hypothetical protein
LVYKIFDRNKGITAGINKLAKGEEPKKPETKPAETKPKKSAVPGLLFYNEP